MLKVTITLYGVSYAKHLRVAEEQTEHAIALQAARTKMKLRG